MIGLAGPSGSGKTYSALQLAYGITGDWSKIALCDTENRSALYYAGEKTGPWEHIDFNGSSVLGGYSPENWVAAIEFAEKDQRTEVLILDSISHEWEGGGGSLDINQKLGGRYTDWAKVTPMHNKFIDKMRQSRLHIIATMRTATEYVVDTNEKGKPQPRKVGLKIKQREGTDYEFGIIFDIEINHFASTSKDRTGLFSNKGPFQITPQTGKELLAWTNSAPSESPKDIYDDSDLEMKRQFANVCTNHGIADKAIMLNLSNEFKGKELKNLKKYLEDHGFKCLTGG